MIAYHDIETRLTGKCHELVRAVVKEGDCCVDATVGNGHDTMFLAQCVGETGKVIGFDVQAEALMSTRQLFEKEEVSLENLTLHGIGHENMTDCVREQVSVVMFNLGYLPGSDKRVITKTQTTLKALAQALELLLPGGLLSVMCYPGHSGGGSEADAVMQWFERIGQRFQAVDCYRRSGARKTSPFLIMGRTLVAK